MSVHVPHPVIDLRELMLPEEGHLEQQAHQDPECPIRRRPALLLLELFQGLQTWDLSIEDGRRLVAGPSVDVLREVFQNAASLIDTIFCEYFQELCFNEGAITSLIRIRNINIDVVHHSVWYDPNILVEICFASEILNQSSFTH